MYTLPQVSFLQDSPRYTDLFRNSQLCEVVVSEADVKKQLKRLDSNKGSGPDDIPSIFAKKCAVLLAKPLSLIFNRSLADGEFPTIWKKARVVPVYKSGDKKDITKYRPICILSVFSKVLESLICPVLTWHLKSVMIENQHGFLKKKSTMSNLALFVDDLSEALDSTHQIDCVYTDLAKAFDVVDHHILLAKLRAYGICGNLIDWMKSYLVNRLLNVVIGGYESKSFVATSGVPQGSNLGPTLFLIFINDIFHCFKHCQFQLYADDLKMYHKINDIDDSKNMQQDLDRLSEWCDENNLKLNHLKCYSISYSRKVRNVHFNYSINGNILENVRQIIDLGVILDHKLSFLPHIDNLINKSLKLLGFVIRSTKEFKKASTKLALYYSLIRSRLEYCSIAWNPYYQVHKDRIERVQRKFLRHLAYKDNISRITKSYSDLLKYYKVGSLCQRRQLIDLIFLHKIINGDVDCPSLLSRVKLAVPKPNARAHIKAKQTFRCRITKSNLGRSAPLNRVVMSYNSMFKRADLDVFHNPAKVYKQKLKKHFNNT